MRVFDPSHHPVIYCSTGTTINWTANICSTLCLLNMTFDRFYSIMRPHKAAAFNTAKRAKITVGFCIALSILYNSPHIFISSYQSGQCVPYGTAMRWVIGQIYYWLSYVVNFVLLFILLLIMNSFIITKIHKSRQFSNATVTNQNQGESQFHESQSHKGKQFEKQTYIILFLVTFGFLILVTPSYLCYIYINVVDYQKSAKSFAEFYLFYHIAQKLFYTNYGINFYLYVISGQKFRRDLFNLFHIKTKSRTDHNGLKSQTLSTSILPTEWSHICVTS